MSLAHHPVDTRLADMLRSGRRLHGIFSSLPSPAVVEMCGYAGFDFIVIDNEHGSADLQTTEHMLRAARASGIVPIVRCFEHDIARVLDMGASGVQVPMVETPENENRWQDEPVQEAIEKVLRAVAAQGKCPGILALSSAEEERYAAMGARYFANVTTGIFTQALRQAACGGNPAMGH